MARFSLALILLVHGLIHSWGFAKEYRLAIAELWPIKMEILLSTDSTKTGGILWLLTGLLFITSAVLLLTKNGWWAVTAVAIPLSQVLIISGSLG